MVNYILIQRNWLIGKRIVENELTTRKDDYGKSIIKELSQKLTQKYGTGFETRNIYYFIDFYNSFPNILQSVSANSLLAFIRMLKFRLEKLVIYKYLRLGKLQKGGIYGF